MSGPAAPLAQRCTRGSSSGWRRATARKTCWRPSRRSWTGLRGSWPRPRRTAASLEGISAAPQQGARSAVCTMLPLQRRAWPAERPLHSLPLWPAKAESKPDGLKIVLQLGFWSQWQPTAGLEAICTACSHRGGTAVRCRLVGRPHRIACCEQWWTDCVAVPPVTGRWSRMEPLC